MADQPGEALLVLRDFLGALEDLGGVALEAMMVISLRSIEPRSMGSGFVCTATVTSLARPTWRPAVRC